MNVMISIAPVAAITAEAHQSHIATSPAARGSGR
jgi:hypothetical protein